MSLFCYSYTYMKKFVGILIIICFLAVASKNVDALSCIYTQPIIGVVATMQSDGTNVTLGLEGVRTFAPEKFAGKTSFSIDVYESIVDGYVSGDFTGLNETEEDASVGSVSVSVAAQQASRLAVGDIIVNGPPFHVCTYRFVGVFDSEGIPKTAIVNDNYQSYTYQGTQLYVSKAGEIGCNGQDVCSYKINFALGNRETVLSPGEFQSFQSSPMSSIALLASSDLKAVTSENGGGSTTSFDWGFNTYVTYVIGLQGFDAPTTSGPLPPPEPPIAPLLPEEPETPVDPLPVDPEMQSPPNPGFPDDEQPEQMLEDDQDDPQSAPPVVDSIPSPPEKKSLFVRFMEWFVGLFG